MVKLFQWLRGYVCFEFKRGFVEGFINDCFEKSVNVQNLVKNGKELSGQCSARTYLRLHRIARKNGGIVEIVERHGPLFAFLRIRNRWGLFVGALCCVVIISFLSGFVWDIQITGANEIRQADVMLFLEENGLQIGSYARNVDRDVIENLLMSSFDKCAWAHINIDGTTATVEIDEAIDKPDVVNPKIIANVKSIKDGIIVKATTYDGWQSVNVGDSVVEGDLLISGIYEGTAGKRNLFAHARGEIIARVNESIDMTINRIQCKKTYTEEKHFKSLYLFGLRIPLYIGSSSYINSDVEMKNEYLELNHRMLPIGIVTKNVKLFRVENVVLTDKELNELANAELDKRISKDFGDAEIISKDVNVSLNTNDAKIKCKLQCLEQIGREYKINVKNKG